MRLLLIRHAESQGNFELRLQGRHEFPLTELGVMQARALASRLALLPLAAIYSSPIGRAIETAGVIAAKVGLDVIPEPRVQEYDFGEAVSGLTWEEIRANQPQVVEALRNEKPGFPRYPGDEGRAAFQHRVRTAMNEVTERHGDDQVVVMITHAGPIAVFLMDVLGREYSRPIPFVLDNASITTVEVNKAAAAYVPGMVLTGINDTCHVAHLQSRDRASGGA